jgi:hypothetical protein
MNKKALENRAFVRNLILKKDPRYATILAELRHTPFHMSSEHFSRQAVGFGACETETYPSSAQEEWDLS